MNWGWDQNSIYNHTIKYHQGWVTHSGEETNRITIGLLVLKINQVYIIKYQPPRLTFQKFHNIDNWFAFFEPLLPCLKQSISYEQFL